MFHGDQIGHTKIVNTLQRLGAGWPDCLEAFCRTTAGSKSWDFVLKVLLGLKLSVLLAVLV